MYGWMDGCMYVCMCAVSMCMCCMYVVERERFICMYVCIYAYTYVCVCIEVWILYSIERLMWYHLACLEREREREIGREERNRKIYI